jgi:hypothetical protein
MTDDVGILSHYLPRLQVLIEKKKKKKLSRHLVNFRKVKIKIPNSKATLSFYTFHFLFSFFFFLSLSAKNPFSRFPSQIFSGNYEEMTRLYSNIIRSSYLLALIFRSEFVFGGALPWLRGTGH